MCCDVCELFLTHLTSDISSVVILYCLVQSSRAALIGREGGVVGISSHLPDVCQMWILLSCKGKEQVGKLAVFWISAASFWEADRSTAAEGLAEIHFFNESKRASGGGRLED